MELDMLGALSPSLFLCVFADGKVQNFKKKLKIYLKIVFKFIFLLTILVVVFALLFHFVVVVSLLLF